MENNSVQKIVKKNKENDVDDDDDEFLGFEFQNQLSISGTPIRSFLHQKANSLILDSSSSSNRSNKRRESIESKNSTTTSDIDSEDEDIDSEDDEELEHHKEEKGVNNNENISKIKLLNSINNNDNSNTNDDEKNKLRIPISTITPHQQQQQQQQFPEQPSFMKYSPRFDLFPSGIGNHDITSPRFSNHSTPSSPHSSFTPAYNTTSSNSTMEIRKRGYIYQLSNFHQHTTTTSSTSSHYRLNDTKGKYHTLNTIISNKDPSSSSSSTNNNINNNGLLPMESPWVKRYVALTQDTLYLFKSPNNKRAFSFLEMASIYRVEPIGINNSKNSQRYSYKKRNFCFAIRSYGKAYMFSAESEQDFIEWINQIEKSMKDCVIESVIHSFRHLLNTHSGDAIKFGETVLQKMKLVVPSWSASQQQMNRDMLDVLSIQKRDEIEFIPLNKWEIDFTQLIIEKKIAEGAFGEVYKASFLGKTVAVKRLKLNYKENVDWDHIIEKLQTEAAIMSQFHHPNLALLIGVCTRLPNICLVMEFLGNGNLYEVLQHTLIADRHLVKMINDIISGMAYLHLKKILHLDLKPLNLLCDDSFSIKVSDFGISKILRSKEEKILQSFKGYGTLLYTADEILYKNEYSSSSDVFSFGIVLYEILWLRDFPNQNFVERETIAFENIREPVSKRQKPLLPPWWNRNLSNMIIQCLSDNPSERPSFEQLSSLFESFDLLKKDNEWFLMRESARNILRLAKKSNWNDMLKFDPFQVLKNYLSVIKDKEAIYYCLSSLIVLYSKMGESNHSVNIIEIFTNIVDRYEQELDSKQDLEEYQRLLATVGNIKYFLIILDTNGITSLLKEKVFVIIHKLIQYEEVAFRFMLQGLVKYTVDYLFKSNNAKHQRSNFINYIIANIISTLSRCRMDTSQLKKFELEGAIDALVFLCDNSFRDDTISTSLQALADLSIRDNTLAILIERKGITPLFLACRTFAPSKKQAFTPVTMQTSISSPNLLSLFENTAFIKPQLKDEGERVYGHMKEAFWRGKNRFNTSPVSESILKRKDAIISSIAVGDSSTPYRQSINENLWQIILSEKDLDNISTENIKVQLMKIFEEEISERKAQIHSQIEVLVGQIQKATQITSYLFLGSEFNAASMKQLREIGISYIVNVSRESPNYFPNEFIYINCITDGDYFNITQYFDQVFQVIDSARRQNKKVLIHSHAGASRGVAFVIAWLMFHRKYSLQRAYKYVKDIRPFVNPSREYIRQLMIFEVKLNGTNTLGTITAQETIPTSTLPKLGSFVNTPNSPDNQSNDTFHVEFG